MKQHLSPSAFLQLHKNCQAAFIYDTFDASPAMLVGSYVDKYFYGGFDEFIAEKKDLIYTRTGTLRAEFKQAEEIIQVIKSDPMLLKYVTSGETQRLVKGKIAGVDFMGYIDAYVPETSITDLKILKSIRTKVWNDELRIKQNIIENYGYIYNMAIYQELIFQETGKKLPCFIAAVSKEPGYDKDIIYIPQNRIDDVMQEIITFAPDYLDIRTGKKEPMRCENCEYCRRTKKISKTINLDEL